MHEDLIMSYQMIPKWKILFLALLVMVVFTHLLFPCFHLDKEITHKNSLPKNVISIAEMEEKLERICRELFNASSATSLANVTSVASSVAMVTGVKERCLFLKMQLHYVSLIKDADDLKAAQLSQHLTEFQFYIQKNKLATEEQLNYIRRLGVSIEKNFGPIEYGARRRKRLINLLKERVEYDILNMQEGSSNCSSQSACICKYLPHFDDRGFGSRMMTTVQCVRTAMLLEGKNKHRVLLPNNNKFFQHMFMPISKSCSCIDNNDTSKDCLENVGKKQKHIPVKYQTVEGVSIYDLMDDPFAWYIGILTRYLLRPNAMLQRLLEAKYAAIGMDSEVTAGIHVRRRYIHEGKNTPRLNISYYLNPVEDFFLRREILLGKSVPRRVFIATDDLTVLKEAREQYPTYNLLFDAKAVNSTIEQNYTNNDAGHHNYGANTDTPGAFSVVLDTLILAKVDFFVGTYSSNVGRVVHRLRVAENPMTAARTSVSLDLTWFLYEEQQSSHLPRFLAVQDHIGNNKTGEVSFRIGNSIELLPDHLVGSHPLSPWADGFIFGKVVETKEIGLAPRFKTVINVAKMID